MARSQTRGADALVQSLLAAGTRHVFTLSGNHIMPAFDAAFGTGLSLVHVRHEAAAVHMADAWARLTGEVGIAMVTGGPGHANALGALYTATMAESPVVLLSGHAPRGQLGMGAFQEMRQADLAAPLAKASWTCASAGAVAGDLARAMTIAAEGRPGPVCLCLPSDVLEQQASPVAAERPLVSLEEPLDLAAHVARLRAARRPLVLCGPAGMSRPGRERMGALEAALGVPVIGMQSPRGVADPALGQFAQVLARADCILLLGKRLDFTLRFGKAPISPDCAFVQVDAHPEEIERTRRAVGARLGAAAVAPLLDAADSILREAGASAAPRSQWADEVREAIAHRPAEWRTATSGVAGRLHPAQALRPLQAILDSHPDAVLVCDGGEFGQWAQACLGAPHRVINGVAGAIGPSLPFALAARMARPDAPVVAVMGDGTFGFHPAEIDTAVRYGLPFLAVVGNDARWNAEYQIQLREYGAERAEGTGLLPTRYDEVAKGFGGYGEQVSEAAQMDDAVERAMRSRLPAVLNVMIEGLAAP